jgi:predicted dehydrogenase
MGYNHARVYADMPEVELVAVADVDGEAVDTCCQKYHCAGYRDYLTLLEEAQPDAVTIAVPTVDHLEVALEAIGRGIDVLIEKPIAFTLEEGQAIIDAAADAGTRLMVGHIERFNPAVLALKARLEAGELGRVFQIDARRQGPFPARIKDVGVVIDLAVHDLDVMRYITGAEVIRAYAETERRIHSSHEDLLSGLVRMDDGTVGTLTINWLTPTKIRELVVTGECGMFRVDYLTQDLYFFENSTADGSDWHTLRVLRGVSEGRMIRHVVAKKEPLRLEQEAFLAAVRGEIPVMVSGQDGLQALRLAEALVQSGTNQQIVPLGERQAA